MKCLTADQTRRSGALHGRVKIRKRPRLLLFELGVRARRRLVLDSSRNRRSVPQLLTAPESAGPIEDLDPDEVVAG